MIEVQNNKYEIIKDYKNAFELDVFLEYYTDFFKDYDYLVGDIAYGKLRLKGFYDPTNKKVKSINNYDNVSTYIEEDCAKECRYYILKRVEGE